MAFKVLLDANVFLDFMMKREGYETARALLQLAVQRRAQAFVTPSILHITAYWLTKAYGSPKAKELLLTLLSDVQVIDATPEMAVAAIHSKIGDVEDALQYNTAIHHKLGYVTSRDKALQKAALPSLPVLTPEELLGEVAG
jgi:predicted nucleic acid-binding protein